MNFQFIRTLFIFRRDLRLEDNSGLIFALKSSEEVIPCFIFTPEQIKKNPYHSSHCLQFMIESLKDLENSLKKKGGNLYLFFGHPEKIVEQCIAKLHIDAVIVNRDYTPYSSKRDQKIESTCSKKNIPFLSFDDCLLHPPEEGLKADGKPYTIFTPYYRNASRLEVLPPSPNRHTNYSSLSIPFAKNRELYDKILPKRTSLLPGGRSAALKILKKISAFSNYTKTRDEPEKDATTHLSAHLKFTTISPRELYFAIKKELGSHSELIRSLFWRDFFTSIAWNFPHVFEGAFHKKFNTIKWENNKQLFRLWREGKTGFPIVDAGMREMNQTGFMHNRVRMIAASLLIKDLHIDWRWGEKYFAQTLIDYDPAVNNGNWQWVASTGCDAQPYFRIFNPWRQAVKFDKDCGYIKRWVPELKSLPSKAIHEWFLKKNQELSDYPIPIACHTKEAAKTLAYYKKCH